MVEFELAHEIIWKRLDKHALYYRNGFNLRKDKVQMSIAYLTQADTLMILNNPQQINYRQYIPLKVSFPIHDFMMLSHYDILLCGLSGEVALYNYNDTDNFEKVTEIISFKINLDEYEIISFVRKSQCESIIIFSTMAKAKFHRLIIYKYDDSKLEYLSEWSISQALNSSGNLESRDKLLLDVNASLVNPESKNIIIIGIEQGYDAGLIIWEISVTSGEVEEKKYWGGYFMG